MSSFLVEPKTIDIITDALREQRNAERKWNPSANIPDEISEQIFGKLLDLNIQALTARYGEKEGEIYDEETSKCYRYAPGFFPTKLETIKRLDCFLYQCTEGDVPNDKLFKEVEKLRATLRGEYIQYLPEYEKLPWA